MQALYVAIYIIACSVISYGSRRVYEKGKISSPWSWLLFPARSYSGEVGNCICGDNSPLACPLHDSAYSFWALVLAPAKIIWNLIFLIFYPPALFGLLGALRPTAASAARRLLGWARWLLAIVSARAFRERRAARKRIAVAAPAALPAPEMTLEQLVAGSRQAQEDLRRARDRVAAYHGAIAARIERDRSLAESAAAVDAELSQTLDQLDGDVFEARLRASTDGKAR